MRENLSIVTIQKTKSNIYSNFSKTNNHVLYKRCYSRANKLKFIAVIFCHCWTHQKLKIQKVIQMMWHRGHQIRCCSCYKFTDWKPKGCTFNFDPKTKLWSNFGYYSLVATAVYACVFEVITLIGSTKVITSKNALHFRKHVRINGIWQLSFSKPMEKHCKKWCDLLTFLALFADFGLMGCQCRQVSQ